MLNKKKFFSAIFTLSGTLILITIAIVVFYNFMNDSSFINGSQAVVFNAAQKEEKPTVVPNNLEKTEYETDKYTSAETEKPTASSTPKDQKINATVEVLNYTGNDSIGSGIKNRLENYGCSVDLINFPLSNGMTTTIVDRNNKGFGKKIRTLIKAGVLKKEVVTGYMYDVTLILTDDILP